MWRNSRDSNELHPGWGRLLCSPQQTSPSMGQTSPFPGADCLIHWSSRCPRAWKEPDKPGAAAPGHTQSSGIASTAPLASSAGWQVTRSHHSETPRGLVRTAILGPPPHATSWKPPQDPGQPGAFPSLNGLQPSSLPHNPLLHCSLQLLTPTFSPGGGGSSRSC